MLSVISLIVKKSFSAGRENSDKPDIPKPY